MTTPVAAPPITIEAQELGIRFRRNRIRNRQWRHLLRKQRGQASSQFWALRHISFKIAQGEAVGVVGANGQGKSTLLKLVAGTLIPDEGMVRLVGGVAPLVNISGGFKGDLTVRDNIYIVAGLHGMEKADVDERFDDIIDFSEVGDFVDTPFRHLSSGMKTRVAFALITSLDEPTVIIDETLSVGDRNFKKKAYARLDQMLAGGKTVFVVSHSERQLQRLCTRGLYMRRGRLVGDGPIDEILQQYSVDQQSEGHPGWKGERKKARRQRRRRKLVAKKLAAEGVVGPSDTDFIDEEDEGLPDTPAPTKITGTAGGAGA
jgi:ABC-2 type transport system ATP-binding protein